MDLLITICARGGSKGILDKNIKVLSGKPLINYTIDFAREFVQHLHGVIELSTDSPEISKVAADRGLKSNYVRPDYLATDEQGKLAVIKDLIDYSEIHHEKTFDYILDLDVTSPLRTIDDVTNAFLKLQNTEEALNIFSVSLADKNPYFNMVEETNAGFCRLVKAGSFVSRQKSPKVYALNASFYIYRRSFFKEEQTSPITDRSLFYLIEHTCFDIDDQLQFDFMEWLLETKRLDFNFSYYP